jgi:hypothetical protein
MLGRDGGGEEPPKPTSIVRLVDIVSDHNFLFYKIDPIRSVARRITSSFMFEMVVLATIFVNLIGMVVSDASAERSGTYSRRNEIIQLVDTVSLFIFVAEFVLKVLSVGLMPLPAWAPSFLRPSERVIHEAVAHLRPVDRHSSRVVPVHGHGDASVSESSAAFPGEGQSESAATVGDGRHSSATSMVSDAAGTPSMDRPKQRPPPAVLLGQKSVRDITVSAMNARVADVIAMDDKVDYYFKSGWNRLDFVILIISLANQFLSSGMGLSGLRAIRGLRPLRGFRFFAPLQIILKSIWRSAGFLANVLVCLGFLYIFFGLMGQQFFQGSLLRRCVVPQGADAVRLNMSAPGYHAQWRAIHRSVDAAPTDYTLYSPLTFCSFESDPRSLVCSDIRKSVTTVATDASGANVSVRVPLVCANVGVNPQGNFLSFDNIWSSVYVVFVSSTLEVGTALCRARRVASTCRVACAHDAQRCNVICCML